MPTSSQFTTRMERSPALNSTESGLPAGTSPPKISLPGTNCEWCGTLFAPSRQGQKFCTKSCSARATGANPEIKAKIGRANSKPKVQLTCEWCETTFEVMPCYSGRRFCTLSCSSKHKRATIPNPMSNTVTRAKTRQSLRDRNHHARVLNGGNGHEPSRAQLLLSQALNWQMEVVARTKPIWHLMDGLPNHYKIDVASRELMIAIEVDGPSHQWPGRQEKDRKKDRALSLLGWTVLRFTNEEVLTNLAQVVERCTTSR